MPVGCVFIAWPGMTEDDVRWHYRQMKQLGYTCLKGIMGAVGWPVARLQEIAVEEGLSPYWYDEGGWEAITPALLEKLGLDPQMDTDEAMGHPKVVDYQMDLVRKRLKRSGRARALSGDALSRQKNQERRRRRDIVPSVVEMLAGHEVDEEWRPRFVEWLKTQYDTPADVGRAWNLEQPGLNYANPDDWTDWSQVADYFDRASAREYRHIIDALRFRAELFVDEVLMPEVRQQQEEDPNVPLRAGGEMALFLPFASRGTNMERIADAMAEGGSFYPSIHLAWHFEEVDFEMVRPVYMQAQLTTDWAKGVWSATWESTGGPQYFSGGKAPFVPEARETTPGFTVDEHTMTQLMLSYLAAGFKGFGFWTWTHRTAGWEAGEFALLDRNREVTPRAEQVGRIGQAARRLRRELWQAHKEPLVGVMNSWDNDAMWAAMSVQGRDKYRMEPIRARIGAARALINANVPWEHVTPNDLENGLGPRYRIIYLPACVALSSNLLQLLREYVEQGGRLVMDMPGAYFDEYGRVFETGTGSPLEQIFGVVFREFTYSNETTPLAIDGIDFEGFGADLALTSAQTIALYQNRKPAITVNTLGQGQAVFIGCQASLNCFRPGNRTMEALLMRHALGPNRSPYACDGAIVYRLAAPTADHYFLVNDGMEVDVMLDTRDYRYRGVSDAIENRPLALGDPITIQSHSGRWLRFEKAE
jgi:beta-galactosidase